MEVTVVQPDPLESEIREAIDRAVAEDSASGESQWAYEIALKFIGIGRRIQGLQREHSNDRCVTEALVARPCLPHATTPREAASF